MTDDTLKKSINGELLSIRECKLDILILQRQNEELCKKNNEEIKDLNQQIEFSVAMLESQLHESGERKIETSAGYVAYRAMPDSWEYDEPVILDWCHGKNKPYYHTVEILEKMNLKKAIQDGLLKLEEVPGLKVIPQDPKFNYKLNAGGELL